MRLLLSPVIVVGFFFLISPAKLNAQAVPIIFDTDIGNDVDDALALGMIHALQSRDECELLAVTITKSHNSAASLTDAINTFYKRGDIPIGITRSGITPNEGKFLGIVNIKDKGKLRYPHDLTSDKKAPDAVQVLRRALVDSKEKVAIVQVGFSTNLAALLDSKGDAISPLSGRELVKKHVKLLSVMAGAFTKIRGKDYHEYNIIKDIPAAQKLANDWPTPIVYSGFEIGIAVPYPAKSIVEDYDYVKHHPLAHAYRLYNPPPHNRPTWDLTSVLYAVRSDAGYFNLSPPGIVTVTDKGFTRFTPKKDGNHRYLILTDNQRIRVTEALVHLASQPPTAR